MTLRENMQEFPGRVPHRKRKCKESENPQQDSSKPKVRENLCLTPKKTRESCNQPLSDVEPSKVEGKEASKKNFHFSHPNCCRSSRNNYYWKDKVFSARHDLVVPVKVTCLGTIAQKALNTLHFPSQWESLDMNYVSRWITVHIGLDLFWCYLRPSTIGTIEKYLNHFFVCSTIGSFGCTWCQLPL